MRYGFQEGEIKTGLAAGGRIRNVFITASADPAGALYRIYFRTSWERHFLPLRSWADRSDRVYRDLDRAVIRIREFGYRGYIIFYEADDPRLARYRGLAARERNELVKPLSG